MTEIGVALDTHIDLISENELRDTVRRIEELGLESVWLPDAMGREPFVLATFLLANTMRLKVGTGIANVHGRDAIAVFHAKPH
jgi:alkanesulfonate monooxygenase SsuD/methylene tetrahydromethanopterin reductase-like flavin-dependent oxidoreductase (luciferase family)